MLMVCPNCKSTDIITVQDQRFCINCGQVMPKEPVAVAATAPAAVQVVASGVASQAVTPVKRRKPGRPKAGRLDVPAQPAVAQISEVKTVAEPSAATLMSHGAIDIAAPEPVASDNVAATEMAQPTPVTPDASVAVAVAPAAVPAPSAAAVAPAPPVAPRISRGQGRRLNDISPSVPKQAAALAQTQEPQDRSDQSAVTVIDRPAPLPYGSVESASLRERFHAGSFGWAFLPALLLAVIAGAMTYVLAGSKAAQALEITQRAGWPLWGELILVGLFFYVSRMISSSAISYGAARRADHRPTPARHQLSAAVNTFRARLGFDLMLTLLQLVLAASVAGLVIMGGTTWPVPEPAQAVVLFVAFLILAYLWSGIGLVQGLGHVALTLSKITARRAFGIGWSMFRTHFEMVGFRFISLVLELVLAVPPFVAVVALAVLLPADLKWLAAASAVLLATLSGALAGAGTAVWWQTAYRMLVQRNRPDEATKLLTGRQPAKTRRTSAALVLTLLTMLSVLAIAWPWLPLF